MDDLAARMVGTWELLRYERRHRGSVLLPFGEDAMGWLQYGGDGRVSATLARRRRPPFAAPPAPDWSGDETAWAQAAMTYVAYTGRYQVEGLRVSHHVDACLYPNWTGITLLRWATLSMVDGEQRLLLDTAPPGEDDDPEKVVSRLWWRRWPG